MKIPVISVRNIGKTYGSGESVVVALKEASFDIYEGELVALLGPSGSGKTTLLTMIGCVNEPSRGTLQIGQKLIYDHGYKIKDTRKIRREEIGFIFQSHNLIPFLSVEENITLVPQMNGVPAKKAQKKAKELLESLDLLHRINHMPSQLSGGESQRVAIARALSNDPKIILADEPTAALDSQRGLVVMELLKKLAKETKAAIIVVTHDERMIPLFDRILRVRDGEVREEEKLKA